MGRPLNKKYFGNRNIGTTGTTDNNIGGEGVAGRAKIVLRITVAIHAADGATIRWEWCPTDVIATLTP